MRLAAGFAMAVLLAANALSAHAACGDDAAHAAQVADTRARIDADCDCAAAPSHSVFVQCAAALVRQRVADGSLAPECARDVRRCASRSTCGRPGTVTCCRTGAHGTTRCRLRAPERCTKSGGCVGNFTSCCDACGPSGCLGATTTTTVPPPCDRSLLLACGGTCPEGDACGTNRTTTLPFESCACFPAGATPCGDSAYPQCGGACLAGNVCQAFHVTTPTPTTFCACVPPDASCGPPPPLACETGGVCPAGQACSGGTLGGLTFCGCAPF